MERATRWAVLVTIGLAALIAALTLLSPLESAPSVGSDKSHHFVAFVALALPLATIRPRWSPALFAIFVLYGAVIEVVQPYVGRSRELGDLVADTAGVAVGITIGWAAGSMLRRRFQGLPPSTQDDEAPTDRRPVR